MGLAGAIPQKELFRRRIPCKRLRMKPRLTTPDGTPASALCFGTMQFGGRANPLESQGMYEASRAAGVNFFDTAHVYTDGASETMLGRFAGPEREQLIIATKCGYIGGCGAENIRRQFDESRQRLNLDMVDILYLHRWDGEADLTQSFSALAALRDAGQIRHAGLSNFAAWQVMKAAAIAARFDLKISILQPMYSLVKRQAEVEILPMAVAEGFAVAPYSPLGGGLLTGKYASGKCKGRLSEDDRYATRYGLGWMHETARDLAALAAGEQRAPATLAVAWAARHPAVTAPIISARTTSQLAPSLAALDHPLSDELYERISALSPTPPPATDRLEEA